MANPLSVGHSAPAPFVFAFQQAHGIRILSDAEGNPLFVLADVCKAVAYGNPSDAQKLIDVDDLEKREVIDSKGRRQEAWCCTEPGLYQFLSSSHVEKAKPFRRWVFAEVLPALRRQGRYGLADAKDALALRGQLLKALGALQGCRCAFTQSVLLGQIRDVCAQLGQPVPDEALIGRDPRQSALEGF